MSKKACIHCGDEFEPNPRVKNQEYCSKQKCQRARRARWQRQKMKDDLDYQEDKRRNEREWHKGHPEYYREWRSNHPEYVERNRELQQIRNANSCLSFRAISPTRRIFNLSPPRTFCHTF